MIELLEMTVMTKSAKFLNNSWAGVCLNFDPNLDVNHVKAKKEVGVFGVPRPTQVQTPQP